MLQKTKHFPSILICKYLVVLVCILVCSIAVLTMYRVLQKDVVGNLVMSKRKKENRKQELQKCALFDTDSFTARCGFCSAPCDKPSTTICTFFKTTFTSHLIYIYSVLSAYQFKYVQERSTRPSQHTYFSVPQLHLCRRNLYLIS